MFNLRCKISGHHWEIYQYDNVGSKYFVQIKCARCKQFKEVSYNLEEER